MVIKPTGKFRRADRLRAKGDFSAVYGRGQRSTAGGFLLFSRANGLVQSRYGLVVSRKLGGAVIRNRLKRRLREALRRNRAELPVAPRDIIIIPKKYLVLESYGVIARALHHSLHAIRS